MDNNEPRFVISPLPRNYSFTEKIVTCARSKWTWISQNFQTKRKKKRRRRRRTLNSWFSGKEEQLSGWLERGRRAISNYMHDLISNSPSRLVWAIYSQSLIDLIHCAHFLVVACSRLWKKKTFYCRVPSKPVAIWVRH